MNAASPRYESKTTLESRARSLLASSIRTIGDGAGKFIYPTPCDGVDGIVDSTTVLATARIFSKLGRSDLAWDFLRTLFVGQGSSGFLPRFVYFNRTTVWDNFEGSAWEEFVGPYPGPKLFGAAPEGYVPQSYLDDAKRKGKGSKSEDKSKAKVKVWSSNTIMAPPYHATSILEIFYLSNQTENDVQNLAFFHDKLTSWHDHLHGKVVSNCSVSLHQDTQHAPAESCLTVRHPWETEIDATSPLWDLALANVTMIVAAEEWAPDFAIPEAARNSFDYPGDESYNSLLYLVQCLSNRAKTFDDANAKRSSNWDNFHSACPFQMVDVGFTAAFSRADSDLVQIGKILKDKNRISEVAMGRSQLSKRMLHGLYDEKKGTFFNRAARLALSSNGTYSSNDTTPIGLPMGSNFLALWDQLWNDTMVESVSSHLLRRSGDFSFYCGDYPLWSLGGCEGGPPLSEGAWGSPPILLLLNYRVWNGLKQNGEVGLGRFLQSSTLNLICGLPNSGDDLTECPASQHFAMAFNATSLLPLDKGECGLASTLTAAMVLDMLIPDKAFGYVSEPPISSSSVIFLIAVEMVLAFGVGVVCLLLSLHLMHRAKADEEGDAFVQIVREREEEELLVQSPMEDMTEMTLTDHNNEMDAPGAGTWSLELISRLSRLKLWEKRDTHTQ